MKFVDEFRDPAAARKLLVAIKHLAGARDRFKFMEVCGGHTHTIYRHGIEHLLPENVELVHGPGCPVCVIPMGRIDDAMWLAEQPDVIFTCFGDMMRVPGSNGSLLDAKARGADVRFVYSPLDALKIALDKPDKQVVFFAIGFETTAPATAMAVLQAEREQLANFCLLVSHVLVPPAIEAILAEPGNGVDGFLAAGHVCTVMGYADYEPLAQRHHVPIVVTGFEPVDLLHGLYLCIRQLEAGEAKVENPYSRAVRREGNAAARTAVAQVFSVQAQRWRGMGEIAASGLGLAPRYRRYDALARFADLDVPAEHANECIAGELLRGQRKPCDCPAFGTRCTPEHPLGATMVSSEGVCAAYYRYRRAESRHAPREQEARTTTGTL
jgi:hydrogenase expression/formation protein HypD